MKSSDLVVIILMYVICAFFTYHTLLLPEQAQTYPLCLLIGLVILNTILLIRCLWRLRSTQYANDLSDIFSNFLSKQFFSILLACVLYLILMPIGGFYLTSCIYLAGVLCFMKVHKWHTLLTIIILIVLIYCVFTMFLKVPLPNGIFLQG